MQPERKPFLGTREYLLSLTEQERDRGSTEPSPGQALHYDVKSHKVTKEEHHRPSVFSGLIQDPSKPQLH